jgi:hypothetical protein
VTGEQLASMSTTEVAKLLAGPEPKRMEPPKPKSKPCLKPPTMTMKHLVAVAVLSNRIAAI